MLLPPGGEPVLTGTTSKKCSAFWKVKSSSRFATEKRWPRLALALFSGRQRPQIGDDGVEIGLADPSVPGESHRWLECRSILANALRDCPLDLGVRPAAESILLVRGDVARHRYAPVTGEFTSALSKVV